MGTLQRFVDQFREDDTAATYVCRSCETDYEVQHHVCPECGSYSVERPDW